MINLVNHVNHYVTILFLWKLIQIIFNAGAQWTANLDSGPSFVTYFDLRSCMTILGLLC